MAERLKRVTVSVADCTYRLNSVSFQDEVYLREGARMLNERMQKYQREEGCSPQEALAMAAIDGIVAALKSKDNYESLQQAVFQKISTLDELLTDAL